MPRLRVIALTLLALVVPSLALGGEESPSGTQTLSVSASLNGCGLAEAAIVCQIDTSWDSLEGADYYAVSVTRPDGSVIDLGQTTGTGRAIFVSYVGPGNYSVQVAAWGTPPGEGDPEVLVREKALSTAGAAKNPDRVVTEPTGLGPAGEGRSTDETTGSATDEPEPPTTPPDLEPPACEEPDESSDPDEDPEAEDEAPVSDELAAEDEPEPDDPPACP